MKLTYFIFSFFWSKVREFFLKVICINKSNFFRKNRLNSVVAVIDTEFKMLKTVVDPIDDDAKIRAAFIAARWFEGIQ